MKISTWAADHHTVIFYKAFSAAGIAAVDYAGWFQQTFDTSFDGQEPKTAIVRDAREYLDSYVFEDVLFPGVYDYQIIGSFDDRHAPDFQVDTFFYYPLVDITSMQGLLFTSRTGADALNELISIVEKTGRVAEFQSNDSAALNVFEVVLGMLFGDEISSSILFAFLGLVFCAVFALYMMYRESNRYLSFHHLYGAPYHSLFLRVLIHLIGLAIVGTLFGYIIGRNQLNLLHRSAYVKVAIVSAIGNVLFACVMQIACFFAWMRNNIGQEGHY